MSLHPCGHDDQADGQLGIVVDDLEAVSALFVELGLELESETTVEGQWVYR